MDSVLVSDVQQSKSVTHMSPLLLDYFRIYVIIEY